jgi:hypothetical protein
VHGDATVLAGRGVGADLAVMTGDCLRPSGWFVFETRRPEVRDWERWEVSPTTIALDDGTCDVTSSLPTMSRSDCGQPALACPVVMSRLV